MRVAQFVHELGPHFRTAFAQELGADAEFFADRQIFVTPGRHLRENRQQLDALLGQGLSPSGVRFGKQRLRSASRRARRRNDSPVSSSSEIRITSAQVDKIKLQFYDHYSPQAVDAFVLDVRDQEAFFTDALGFRKVGVDTGGSNIQFAIDPETGRRVVIEMNPRVSRSSALASKATGFPIAKIAALLAVGYRLDEIPNDITKKTPACFEPSLDYVVVKIPRFAFEKFPGADATLTIAGFAVLVLSTLSRRAGQRAACWPARTPRTSRSSAPRTRRSSWYAQPSTSPAAALSSTRHRLSR